MNYRLALYMVFSLSFVYLAYSWLLPTTHLSGPVKEARALIPDAWMETVDATFMGKDGKMLMKIHTPTIKHYAENDTTLLTTPEFFVYHQSTNPWQIQAGKATAIKGMRQIHLSDSVTLRHPGDIRQPKTWIDTEKLTLHPHQKTADTAEEVTLRQPTLTLRGRGLKADLNTGDIELLAETRGNYAFAD